jgi:Ca2+-binding EF-hand superfamily protein
MKPPAGILLGLLAFCCPALTRAAPPPAADIRRDFTALAAAASPRSITAEEWEGASFALFQGADKNKDNFLEVAELGTGAFSRDTLVTADENQDGKLSVTEFMQVRRAIFKAADINRDDALTYFEFELLVLLGQYGWTDANRNGRVEVSELREALTQAFSQLDGNHDGKLTQEEVPYMGVSQWRLADADENGSLVPDEFIRGYLLSLGAI